MANQKKNTRALAAQAETKKKKWTKKRILAASIIGAATLAAVVFGIMVLVMRLEPVRPIKSTDEEARVVGTVGDYEVKYEELRYITLLHKQSLDAEMGAYESLDAEGREVYETALNARVMKDLKSNYVIMTLCDRYGIEVDSLAADNYVQDEIEAFVGESFESSMAAYEKWLADNDLTDNFLRLLYKVNYLEAALLDHFTTNGIDMAYGEENVAEFVQYMLNDGEWVRTVHAYYPKESQIMTATEAQAQAEATAVRLAEIADDEARWDEMRSAIGKAPFVSSISVTGHGFVFTYGQMGEEYENIAFALGEYESSSVYETEDGYYVLMRLPLEEDYLKENAMDFLEQYQYAVLKRYEDTCREELAFAGNDYFLTISLAEME